MSCPQTTLELMRKMMDLSLSILLTSCCRLTLALGNRPLVNLKETPQYLTVQATPHHTHQPDRETDVPEKRGPRIACLEKNCVRGGLPYPPRSPETLHRTKGKTHREGTSQRAGNESLHRICKHSPLTAPADTEGRKSLLKPASGTTALSGLDLLMF